MDIPNIKRYSGIPEVMVNVYNGSLPVGNDVLYLCDLDDTLLRYNREIHDYELMHPCIPNFINMVRSDSTILGITTRYSHHSEITHNSLSKLNINFKFKNENGSLCDLDDIEVEGGHNIVLYKNTLYTSNFYKDTVIDILLDYILSSKNIIYNTIVMIDDRLENLERMTKKLSLLNFTGVLVQ